MVQRIAEWPPRLKARVAGAFYLLVFIAGGIALTMGGRPGMVAGLIAGACYIAVTLLFYDLFKPVHKGLSLLAALISLAGILVGPLPGKAVHPLVFFGLYCLLIAYLILKSTFLPRFLAAFMALAGLGWLTFVSAQLVKDLYPYNLAPGILGEGVLTLWLLVRGVDARRWYDQSRLPIPEPA